MAGGLTLAENRATFEPPAWMKVPDGHLIQTTGMERGLFWDGLSETSGGTEGAEPLGITAPTGNPGVTGSGSGTINGTYTCYYRYKDQYGYFSSLSAAKTVIVTNVAQLNWSSVTNSSETRANPKGKKELWRSVAGVDDVLYFITELDATDTTHTDTNVDTDLINNALDDPTLALSILKANGRPNANRFTPPPTNKAVCVWFQDRAFYFVDVIYNEGTINISNGSATVTGTGTSWTSDMVGRELYVRGGTKPYTIATVPSATSLTIDENYADSNDASASYSIRSNHNERNRLYYSEPSEPESVPTVNFRKVQHDQTSDDELTGGITHRGFMWVAKENHLYRVTYVSQPHIDLSINLAAYRGAFNNRCLGIAEDTLYLMDEHGIWAVGGAQVGDNIIPIGDAIHDLWRDAKIDFTQKKKFFISVDQEQQVVKFHVSRTGQTYPKHAFVYHYRNKVWWEEEYHTEFGGWCLYPVSGRRRHVMGTGSDTFYVTGEGTLDGTKEATETIRGTATTAGSTTILVDTGASFPLDAVGASLVIAAGTGKGQERRITARNQTTLQIDSSWNTAIATDSVYIVGGIKYTYRMPTFRYVSQGTESKREFRATFQPTDNAATLDVRLFRDHNALPENNARDFSGDGRGVSWTEGDPDKVLDLVSNQNDSGIAGHHAVEYDDSYDEKGHSERWVSPYIRGFQGQDRIRIYGLELHGVEAV